MKIMCISLGCDKNLVDTERMLGLLLDEGYEFTDDENEAEAALINTCCFIDAAKEESINTILEVADLKQSANLKLLIVTGCLAERYRGEIMDEIPEVDAVLGTAALSEIADVIRGAEEGAKCEVFEEPGTESMMTCGRILTTGGAYEYLKIAEGCDKHCTYCIIPSLRGPYRSVPMDDLISEAEDLAARGVKELILVAQETTLYGVDLYGEKKLPELLRRLCKIEGLVWIRLLYCYPEEITDELIQTIADEKKICHYLDIPIQHASDDILKRMGRKTSRYELEQRIAHLREKIPDITLRTTLITGFPGETPEDQEELLDFVKDERFDRLGVFTYSAEEGTPAASYPDQIPEDIKEERRDEIMELQQTIAFEKAEEQVGRVFDVIVEGELVDEGVLVGRTFMDAPEVDGYIFIEGNVSLQTGDFVKVRATQAREYDLIGEICDESAE